MAKPTPGPWSANRWRVCAGVEPPAKFKWICDTATNNANRNDENAANATLIAAAPDLLEACSAALKEMRQCEQMYHGRTIIKLRDALQRATQPEVQG